MYGKKNKITRSGLVLREPLGKLPKYLLIAGCALLLFIPLLPLSLEGSALMNDSPEFCINCHIMNGEYTGWSHSAHRSWATCADCHIPQESIVTKVAGKARNGLFHGYALVFHSYPDPIRIKRLNAVVVRNNCVRCHFHMVAGIHETGGNCWNCHRGISH